MCKIVDFFDIISAIATAIAAFLTFKTLKEVKAQRESMYMPDIIIEENQFYIYGIKTNVGTNFREFSIEQKQPNYISDQYTISKLPINVFNIGLASAKNVTVEFKFDIDKCISIIETINKNLPESKAINAVKLGKGVKIKGNEDSVKPNTIYFLSDTFNTKINHILPINISDKPFKLNLPTIILEFYTIIISQFWLDKSKNKDFPNFPGIQITFTFFDIGNKKHTKKYDLNLHFGGGTNLEAWNTIKVK